MTTKDKISRLLLLLGAVLFLVGLLSGFAVGAMENPRMGLSAHLEATFNGILLLVLGAIWHRLRLSRALHILAAALFVFGTWTNWLSTQFGALWGTGRMTPIASAGFEGSDLEEAIVAAGLLSLSFAMIVATGILIIGLWRGR